MIIPLEEARTIVILLNYNGHRDTRECVNSIHLLEYGVGVLLVDNCSTVDGIVEVVNDYDNIYFVQSSNNCGFGCGNNLGIDIALRQKFCEYIFILNNDTVVSHEAIASLERFMDDNNDVPCCSPLILRQDDPEIVWYGGGYFSWYKGGAVSPYFNKKLNNSIATKTVSFVSGCAMFVRKKVFESIGNFDKNFFMYVEDVDLSLRISTLGNMIVCTNAVIYHKSHASLNSEHGQGLKKTLSIENPKLKFYIHNVITNYRYLLHKHKPPLMEKLGFYLYFYLRWLKHAGYLGFTGNFGLFRFVLGELFRK